MTYAGRELKGHPLPTTAHPISRPQRETNLSAHPSAGHFLPPVAAPVLPNAFVTHQWTSSQSHHSTCSSQRQLLQEASQTQHSHCWFSGQGTKCLLHHLSRTGRSRGSTARTDVPHPLLSQPAFLSHLRVRHARSCHLPCTLCADKISPSRCPTVPCVRGQAQGSSCWQSWRQRGLGTEVLCWPCAAQPAVWHSRNKTPGKYTTSLERKAHAADTESISLWQEQHSKSCMCWSWPWKAASYRAYPRMPCS